MGLSGPTGLHCGTTAHECPPLYHGLCRLSGPGPDLSPASIKRVALDSMAFSTAHREPTHRSPSLIAWHPTLLYRPRHHRHHHHAQQHRTSLMRTAAAATAICHPEIQKWALVRPATLRDLLVGQRDLISPMWWQRHWTRRKRLSLPAHCRCWSGGWSGVHHTIRWCSVPARSWPCSVFKGLFHSAIPLLKGPVLWASVHLTGDVLRGKTMKQALKNRIALLVGNLLQAAGVQSARKHATPAKQCASKSSAPEQGQTWKRPRHRDIFAW